MKIAVIGTGIAGNFAAYQLSQQHDVTVFEQNDYVGGHTHTHQVNWHNESHKIDSGFIVFNKKTYPNFLNLINELEVEYQPTNMSFSVKCENSGLEYNGTNLNSLFAQRRNLLKPSFYRMIKDILRFNEQSLELLIDDQNRISLGDYLAKNQYSAQFINHYIVPMGAAIWSTDHQSMFDFPAQFFVRFFHNHGMLSVDNRPQWYVIKNGSNAYLEKLTKPYKDNIITQAKVSKVDRQEDKVVITAKGECYEFDYVFIASHSDQALGMLENPTLAEKAVLSAIPYTKNQAIMHTDESVLPKRKLAWAAWNYHLQKAQSNKVALTYNMNILQSLKSEHTYCVSLNYEHAINPKKIIKTLDYTHPFFTQKGIQAQLRQSEINGVRRTFYCGAYWRYGFHEDGVVSSIQALNDFNNMLLKEEQNSKVINLKNYTNEKQNIFRSHTA